MPRLTVHGRWSDMLLNIMEDKMDTCFLWGVLKNIWSMRLQECLANLVGKLILGKKLFVHIKSRKSPNLSRSEICNKFILKSPTIAAYVFSRWIISIIGESSDMNCCIFALFPGIVSLILYTINMYVIRIYLNPMTAASVDAWGMSPWWPLLVLLSWWTSLKSNHCHPLNDWYMSIFWGAPGGWFNIKMTSYRYRKSHCGDKTILRPSYLHNGISYAGKMISLCWIRA